MERESIGPYYLIGMMAGALMTASQVSSCDSRQYRKETQEAQIQRIEVLPESNLVRAISNAGITNNYVFNGTNYTLKSN